jgi:hypothetical protein
MASSRRGIAVLFTLVSLLATACPQARVPSPPPDSSSSMASSPLECTGYQLTPADAANVPDIVNAQAARTTFCFAAGTYRMTDLIVPKDGDRFVGVGRGADGTILSGARLLDGWEFADGLYIHTGDVALLPHGGECFSGTECTYPDWLFKDGRPLDRVLSPCSVSRVTPGAFCIDYTARRIYVASDPAKASIEYSWVPRAFEGGTGVVIEQLAINGYANTAALGAVVRAGTGWTVDGIHMENNHACAIALVGDEGTLVQRSRFVRNGQEGACGSSTGAAFMNNEVAHNNTLGFDGLWEAGGTKFVHSTDLRVIGNHVHDNNGAGLWFDIDNAGVLIEGNRVERNTDLYENGNGIMYEISCDARIETNVVTRNAAAGIFLSNSHDVTVGGPEAGNRVVDNSDYGIRLLADDRTDMQSNCGSQLHIRNVLVTGNEIRMAGTTSLNGLQRVAPALVDNVKFVGNRYHMPPSACSHRRWKWWNGSIMNTVRFTGPGPTWQRAFGQDPAPGGRCTD